jgi:hypothetical protein
MPTVGLEDETESRLLVSTAAAYIAAPAGNLSHHKCRPIPVTSANVPFRTANVCDTPPMSIGRVIALMRWRGVISYNSKFELEDIMAIAVMTGNVRPPYRGKFRGLARDSAYRIHHSSLRPNRGQPVDASNGHRMADRRKISKVAYQPSLTIVTGASSNHFYCLRNLLYSISRFEPGSRTIVYDLGLSNRQKRKLKNWPNIRYRRFDFNQYPSWVRITGVGNKGKASGCYAWKAIIIQQVLREFNGLLLWLDAGDLVLGRLTKLRRILRAEGVYSPKSSGTISQWTHEGTLQYMGVPQSFLDRPNRNAAIVGLNANHSAARELATEWFRYSLQKKCIDPVGAFSSNHRYDQAILSILLYRLRSHYCYKLYQNCYQLEHHNDRRSFKQVRLRLDHA